MNHHVSQKKLLVVDDEDEVRNFVGRLMKKEGYLVLAAANGSEAVRLAEIETPDLILMDVTMPVMNGYAACITLRSDFKTRYIPIIFLSSKETVPDKIQGLKLGADDYLTKPCDPEELKARVETVLLRCQRNLAINPLTKLPGNSLIEEEVNEKIRSQRLFAFAYLDIDHFKAYNDLYGFKAGDGVIQFVATLLLHGFQRIGEHPFFIGHIGGDDFVFMTDPSMIEGIANTIANSFDQERSHFYSEKDINRGFVLVKSRKGQVDSTPLMSLSIAIVTNEKRDLLHYGKVVEIASEMKRFAKTLPDRTGSLVVKDKRKDKNDRV